MSEPRNQLIRPNTLPEVTLTPAALDYIESKQHAITRLTALLDLFPSVPPRDEAAALLEQGKQYLSERSTDLHIAMANKWVDYRHKRAERAFEDPEAMKRALHREIPKRGYSPAVLYGGIERMFEAAVADNVEWRPGIIPILHYCRKVAQEAAAALIILDWPPTADERSRINYNIEFGLSVERDERSRQRFGDERDRDDYEYYDGEPGPVDVARCREVEIKRYLHAAKAGLHRRAVRRCAIACFDDNLRMPSEQELAGSWDVFVTIRDNPQRQTDINNFIRVASKPYRAKYLI